MLVLIREIIRFRYLLWIRLVSDIRGSIADTKLGYFWFAIDPILFAAVYYFIIEIVFERGGPGFFLYVLLGLWPWTFFSRSVAQAATSFISNRNLILTLNAPLSIYLISPILMNGVITLAGLFVTSFFLEDFSVWNVILFLPYLLLLVLLTYAIGSVMALLTCFARDFSRVLEYVLRMTFFLTPILYEFDRIAGSERIPEWAKSIYLMNPMAHIVPAFRDSFASGELTITPHLVGVLVMSMILIEISVRCLRKGKNWIVERI